MPDPKNSIRVRQNPRFKNVWAVEALTLLPSGRVRYEILSVHPNKSFAETEANGLRAAQAPADAGIVA